jgi:HD superfamily phosphodiesterase
MLNHAFKCVLHLSKKYNIDESHSLKHSMEVLKFAEDIYCDEVTNTPILRGQRNVIMTAAILHDMCDRKYVSDEATAIEEIRDFMKGQLSDTEMDVVVQIITTMSYSKVKKNGFPNLGRYQTAYHVVREADLLAAYDIDRCVMFAIYVHKMEYEEAVKRARVLYKERVMSYRQDGLFHTPYSQRKSFELHVKNMADFHSDEIVIQSDEICDQCFEDRFWGGVGDCTNRVCKKFTCRCNKFRCSACHP